MPPLPGFAFVFVALPRGSAPCGAPPPGYYMAPLRGSELGSLALAKFTHHLPFNFRFIGMPAPNAGGSFRGADSYTINLTRVE